jgi:hypothetical protein
MVSPRLCRKFTGITVGKVARTGVDMEISSHSISFALAPKRETRMIPTLPDIGSSLLILLL